LVSASEAESGLAALTSEPELIAIDGLPLSGKSTFAERLADRFGWAVLGFEDFYLPERDWPANIEPSFPFPFFRIDEFRQAVRSLQREGRVRLAADRLANTHCRLSRCALTDAGPALTEHIRTTSSAARPWTSGRPSLTQP
jgi:hypothetical protein